MEKNILITGIGGNVGQGILRILTTLPYHLRLIGTNTDLISAGNHLCDAVYKVPFAKNKNYITQIQVICSREKINLIIPSTDYESYYLSLNKATLPIVATSPARTNKIFLDKYLTAQELSRHGIPFAQACLPSQYQNIFSSYIVKPRKGRGSRDIFLNPRDPKKFPDTYIIQKLYTGKEITTGFYVTKKNELFGSITFFRELSSGMTTKCEITRLYDDKIHTIIQQVIQQFTIRGSCNIQSVVTSRGNIVPFEINSRISGTNSIRSQFGFEDVRYTVEEYLFRKELTLPTIKQGSAIRIFMDIIYPDSPLQTTKNKYTPHHIF